MLQRPVKPKPKPASLRAAEQRARRRAGIEHVVGVATNTRRLVAALRDYSEGRHVFPEGRLSKRQLEAELTAFVEDMVTGRIGPPPPKKK